MNPIVYLVTEGSYDDYCVRAVMTDPVAADRLAEKLNDGAVEKVLLDQDPSAPDGMKVYTVRMDRRGEKISADEDGVVMSSQFVRDAFDKGYFEIFASSAQEAITLANEQRLAMIASGEWK